jgi:hypothetical protein
MHRDQATAEATIRELFSSILADRYVQAQTHRYPRVSTGIRPADGVKQPLAFAGI